MKHTEFLKQKEIKLRHRRSMKRRYAFLSQKGIITFSTYPKLLREMLKVIIHLAHRQNFP